MKSPRFLAALAMAAVLTTGATTAHASFQQVTGSGANGQTPMQQVDLHDTATAPSSPTKTLDVQGDVQVDGTFTKSINNFPKPDKDGRFLRVSMPIKMDFTYDVDTHMLTSAEGVITNNSVHVTGTGNNQVIEDQEIKMTLVDFADAKNGISTMGPDIEFVDSVNTKDKDKVQLPFELSIDSATGNVAKYSLKRITEIKDSHGQVANPINAIDIAKNSSVKLKIGKINGQNIGNEELITQNTSLTSHSLTLKFEYAGK